MITVCLTILQDKSTHAQIPTQMATVTGELRKWPTRAPIRVPQQPYANPSPQPGPAGPRGPSPRGYVKRQSRASGKCSTTTASYPPSPYPPGVYASARDPGPGIVHPVSNRSKGLKCRTLLPTTPAGCLRARAGPGLVHPSACLRPNVGPAAHNTTAHLDSVTGPKNPASQGQDRLRSSAGCALSSLNTG